MDATTRQQIDLLLSDPDKLRKKKPFYRSVSDGRRRTRTSLSRATVSLTGTTTAALPSISLVEVPQEQFMTELDPFSHKVLFDDNVPAITVKVNRGDGFLEIEQYRMAVPFQVLIRDKQVRHLCVNRINHTMLNTNPSDEQMKYFVRFKQAWAEKNMEGVKTKFVKDQKSYGDAGLLFFMSDGKVCTKNINFEDGYVIITHKNAEGKHILECLYYSVTDYDGNTTEYIDCYDDEYMTRLTNTTDAGGTMDANGWVKHEPVRHGFPECPLITKRGEVAWNRGQSIIESYEALYNTFIVIQKKFGWGILYVKGKFNQNAKKIATSVVLNDTSMDEHADAKFLNPPEPSNMTETLDQIEQTIQIATGTTFILPKDIKISGDTSGLAVEMTQELDMATAQDGVIEWQNVANKMSRLFKAGLATELINSGDTEYSDAKTAFDKIRIYSKFDVWKPKSEEAHNQMLTALYQSGNGGISRQTYVEKNTISTPDELMRIRKEHEEQIKEQEEQERKAAEIAQKTSEQTIAIEK